MEKQLDEAKKIVGFSLLAAIFTDKSDFGELFFLPQLSEWTGDIFSTKRRSRSDESHWVTEWMSDC